jgi:hypothetical protein
MPYLEVHDPDHLNEASSTITRPTGGSPPVTYPPPFIKTLLRKVKKTAKENRKENRKENKNRTPKTIPSIASPSRPSHPSLLLFHRTNHAISRTASTANGVRIQGRRWCAGQGVNVLHLRPRFIDDLDFVHVRHESHAHLVKTSTVYRCGGRVEDAVY